MPIMVDRAGPSDLPAVLALLERCGLPTDGLAAHFSTALVARHGGAVVGSAALEVYGAAGLLRSVAVEASRRGQGLGGRLTQAAIDLARQLGVSEVYLLTETAIEFFPRFGFAPIERTQAPEAVRQSVEFASACPDSAAAMKATL